MSYSNVMSTLAVFLVLAGGSALAATLPKNSVRSKVVKDNSLRSKDLKNGKAVAGEDVVADDVQLRVGESCPEGQAIRVINVDGGVACEADDQRSADGPPSGAAGGDLTGAYPDPAIAPGAVNSAKVVDGSLTGNDVSNQSLASDDVANGSLTSDDVANESLTGIDVASGSLTGQDIDEQTLGQVPSALLGGLGRSGTVRGCNPESQTFEFCGGTPTLSVPPGARALVLGNVRALTEGGTTPGGLGEGYCRLWGTSIGTMSFTQQYITSDDEQGDAPHVTLVAVTPPLSAGTTSFWIQCNEEAGGAYYDPTYATAVLISGT